MADESEEDRLDGLAAETRRKVGLKSATLLDAIDGDTLEALGLCYEPMERIVGLMRERGVDNANISSILIGAVVQAVYDHD